MNITAHTQHELTALLERFQQLEQSAAIERVAPPGQLVVVRADGIKHSKRFLKDDVESPTYDNALHQAISKTHQIWRNWAPKEDRPYLIGALRLSDEVSFVLNRGENHYQRRLLKMTTTLASTLSGAMSLAYLEAAPVAPPASPPILAFDGRMLLLSSSQGLADYIRLRRLLHGRNAMTRVLRLRSRMSEAQLYDRPPKLAEDIFRLSQAIESHGLWPLHEQAAGGAGLYIDAEEEGLRGINLPSDPTDDTPVRRVLRQLSQGG